MRVRDYNCHNNIYGVFRVMEERRSIGGCTDIQENSGCVI